jgi:hypothetical protein
MKRVTDRTLIQQFRFANYLSFVIELMYYLWHERLWVIISFKDLTNTQVLFRGCVYNYADIGLNEVIAVFKHCGVRRIRRKKVKLHSFPNSAYTSGALLPVLKSISRYTFDVWLCEGSTRWRVARLVLRHIWRHWQKNRIQTRHVDDFSYDVKWAEPRPV